MVDITSLKARLARLRLGSEFEDKNPELRDPASDSLDKKRGKKKQKKAAQDPYNEYTKNTGDKRKKKNKLTRSDQKRGKRTPKKITFDDETASLERDLDVITDPDDYDAVVKEIDDREAYKKKHGEDPVDRKRRLNKMRKNQTKKATQDPGYGDYTKNTGGKRKKKNKLTRSDKKRP